MSDLTPSQISGATFRTVRKGYDPDEVEAPRRKRLHEFLDGLAGHAAALYVVGDLFEFLPALIDEIERRKTRRERR